MQSLQHHLLIAMPALNHSFFEKAVIYLCNHNAQGAMGLMINQPIGFDINFLLSKMDSSEPYTKSEVHNQDVLVGGPVMTERGFVLHTTNEMTWTETQVVAPNLSMTTSHDVLQALGSYKSPQQYLITLGYSGWAPQQLEQEIAANTWLTSPADHELLFDIPLKDRWQEATKRIGFNPVKLSSDIGHA
tara:strand:+ start:2279 stop:2842 length:564 start_codon:yes stop_codon:yes gene_type:complete